MNTIISIFLIINILFIPSQKPTWSEFVRFLEQDHTNWVDYGGEGRTCEWFAMELENNAHSKGIDVYRVRVSFENGINHIFNAVDTLDLGVVYIEPQNDIRYSNVEIGKYLCLPAYNGCWITKGMKIKQITIFDSR